MSPEDKLREIVAQFDADKDHWSDDQDFWQVTSELRVTVGDVRAWLDSIES